MSAIPSGIALILLPKCPACIAAYLAVSTGLTVSLTAASHLRTALVVVCWGMIAVSVLALVKRRSSG